MYTAKERDGVWVVVDSTEDEWMEWTAYINDSYSAVKTASVYASNEANQRAAGPKLIDCPALGQS
jgi:hypothetical protein